MADITMCQNETCLSKSTCWRFTATPNQYWQSYCYFGEKDQLKWILRLGLECDKEDRDIAEFSALLLIALQNNLFPETEPVFEGEDFTTVVELLELIKDPEVIKQFALDITKLDKKEEGVDSNSLLGNRNANRDRK